VAERDDRVLNPALYRALLAFGPVGVAKRGERAAVGRPYLDLKSGRYRTRWATKGEHYLACCPYCNDTKNHLAVSYLYGQPDPSGGYPMRDKAHCYHGCLQDPENQEDLARHLTNFVNKPSRGDIAEHVPFDFAPSGPKPWLALPPPENFRLLSDLPDGHIARAYAEGRGFNPDFLARQYGVGFCDPLPRSEESRWARYRLMVPIHRQGEVVCWQGRWLAEDYKERDRPKYRFNKEARSAELLYNLDAVRGNCLVLVEGVMDAWSVGLDAVARFSDGLRDAQLGLLVKWHTEHPDGAVYLIADPGPSALKKARGVLSRLRAARIPSCLVPLPIEGVDPGATPTHLLRQALLKARMRLVNKDLNDGDYGE